MKKRVMATITAVVTSLFLFIGMSPANAWYMYPIIRDSPGGDWGSSCRYEVEYHGNGWATYREVRHQQWGVFWDGPCYRTGKTFTKWGNPPLRWYIKWNDTQ